MSTQTLTTEQVLLSSVGPSVGQAIGTLGGPNAAWVIPSGASDDESIDQVLALGDNGDEQDITELASLQVGFVRSQPSLNLSISSVDPFTYTLGDPLATRIIVDANNNQFLRIASIAGAQIRTDGLFFINSIQTITENDCLPTFSPYALLLDGTSNSNTLVSAIYFNQVTSPRQPVTLVMAELPANNTITTIGAFDCSNLIA